MRTPEEIWSEIDEGIWNIDKLEYLKRWRDEIVTEVAGQAAVLSSEDIIGKSLKDILVKTNT